MNFGNLVPLPSATPPLASESPATHLVLMNAQSVRNKTLTINEYVRYDQIDLLTITETWLKWGGDAALINELSPGGYSLLSVPRRRGRGGGIGLLHRDCFSCNLVSSRQYKHMELMQIRITGVHMKPLDVYVLYHPPTSGKNFSTVAALFRRARRAVE